jgi:S-formylglutathione hydrolase FrmB
MVLEVLTPVRTRRRARRQWVFVVVLLVIGVAAAAIRAHITAARRGYSDTRGATVVHYTLASRLLGRSLSEIGVVPAGGGRRPLLVLLHGRHDPSPVSWLIPSKTGPESLLSNQFFRALASLGARAPVVVLVNGGGHSYYHDRKDGPWASTILREAIPDAVRRFRTVTGRIAIGGESMGGYGALHLAALRPAEFCAAGAHSAALWLTGGQSASGAFDDAADYARNDVFAAARRGAFDRLPVWIDGGTADPFRSADAAFVEVLRRRSVQVRYHVWPGGHTASYWNAHMSAYLRFYASALAGCRA